MERRYSEDQPRDDHGRFASTGDAGDNLHHAVEAERHRELQANETQKGNAAKAAGDREKANAHYDAARLHDEARIEHGLVAKYVSGQINPKFASYSKEQVIARVKAGAIEKGKEADAASRAAARR